MRLLAITDRTALPGQHTPGMLTREESRALADLVASWAAGGIATIQLREKDLSPESLLNLTAALAGALASSPGNGQTALLVNGPPEIALQAGAQGFHLGGGWTVAEVAHGRQLFAAAGRPAVVSVACHSAEDGVRARVAGAEMALFAPVFRKPLGGGAALPGQGLEALADCCRAAAPLPVYALGGVMEKNASACIEAGAGGIAGIGLFLSEHWRRLSG